MRHPSTHNILDREACFGSTRCTRACPFDVGTTIAYRHGTLLPHSDPIGVNDTASTGGSLGRLADRESPGEIAG